MTDEIRRALEARVAASAGSLQRRERIRARIMATEAKEEPIMKRKLSMALAVVLALMLLGGTALAAELGIINLFEYFSKQDSRWGVLADKAVLETEAPLNVQHDVLGEVEAVITNAYYDGANLQVAYMVKNNTRIERWEPSEEQIALITARAGNPIKGDVVTRGPGGENAAEIIDAEQRAAMEAGEPYAFVEYTVFVHEYVTANGVQLTPRTVVNDTLADGTYCSLVEYETPLPESAANQDELTLCYELREQANFFYFDGETACGTKQIRARFGEITGVVARDAGSAAKRFTGSGVANGVPVTVSADVSIIRADVTVTAAEDAFLLNEADGDSSVTPWGLILTDEQGRMLNPEGGSTLESVREMRVLYNGTGFIPESLTVAIYVPDQPGGEDQPRVSKEASAVITLLPE